MIENPTIEQLTTFRMIVYLITNTINDKKYIGISRNTFCGENGRYAGKNWWKSIDNKHLKYDINILGHENFKISILDLNINTIKELKILEDEYAIKYNCYHPNGYNVAKCGIGYGWTADLIYKCREKTYKFKSPSGEIKEITNLKKFCKENKLDHCYMYQVAQGKRSNHKGWQSSNVNPDYVILLSPDNKKIKLELIRNSLTKFCNSIGISDISGMYMLIYNYVYVKQCKGWTVLERSIK